MFSLISGLSSPVIRVKSSVTLRDAILPLKSVSLSPTTRGDTKLHCDSQSHDLTSNTMGEDKEGPSVIHRTAVVAPETTSPDDANDTAQHSANNSPMLSAKQGTFIKINGSQKTW